MDETGVCSPTRGGRRLVVVAAFAALLPAVVASAGAPSTAPRAPLGTPPAQPGASPALPDFTLKYTGNGKGGVIGLGPPPPIEVRAGGAAASGYVAITRTGDSSGKRSKLTLVVERG